MERKNITKFPKGFFQKKRPTITASEALKNDIPIEWEKNHKDKNDKQIAKLDSTKKSRNY